MIADAISKSSSTRLTGRRLFLARSGWTLIFLYVIWKLILGTPLYHAELQQICTDSVEICSQRVSPTIEDTQEIAAAGVTLAQYADLSLIFQLVGSFVWIGVGLLIFALRSDDWMALLVSAMMIMITSGSESDPIIRAYPQITWIAELGFSLQNILLFLVIGLFPNGRFAPRWMRWYWLVMIGLSFISMGLQFFQVNLGFMWGIGWLSFLTLGPYSQVYRYVKVSSQSERLQIKWVVLGFVSFAALVLTGILMVQLKIIPNFMSTFIFDVGSLLIPLGFGVAVLRYRLWDIDIIIRRTLVYGGLTVTLALVFFGGVATMQRVFGSLTGMENSPIAIVVSTLLIAALASPLRRRIQDGIDRRFYRKKYNAEHALARFATTARDETDITQLRDELLAVVNETIQPEQISLWLKE